MTERNHENNTALENWIQQRDRNIEDNTSWNKDDTTENQLLQLETIVNFSLLQFENLGESLTDSKNEAEDRVAGLKVKDLGKK